MLDRDFLELRFQISSEHARVLREIDPGRLLDEVMAALIETERTVAVYDLQTVLGAWTAVLRSAWRQAKGGDGYQFQYRYAERKE